MFKHKGHEGHEGFFNHEGAKSAKDSFLEDVNPLPSSGEVGSVSRGVVPVC